MLTRSKIRELTHADWSASTNRISEDINWFPGISLGNTHYATGYFDCLV